MTQIVPLNKDAHRTLKVDGRASAAYGDKQHFVQVIVNEFAQLVVRYPILFTKNAGTGQLYCGAMLGFDEGENLFLEEWRQRESYRPLALQRMPFYTHGPEIGIDLDHPRVGAESGQPLFDHAGRPSRYLQGIIWAFQDLKPGIETTNVFIARLLELKLIEPIDIEVELDDGTKHQCRRPLHHQPGRAGEAPRRGGGGAVPARLPHAHPFHDRLIEAVAADGAPQELAASRGHDQCRGTARLKSTFRGLVVVLILLAASIPGRAAVAAAAAARG